MSDTPLAPTPPDEGVIKFTCEFSPVTPGPFDGVEAFAAFRQLRERLVQRGWLGEYTGGALAGIGFGNMSVRSRSSRPVAEAQPSRFWITGSGTGGVQGFSEKQLSLVTDYDVARNHVSCAGGVRASSESMTHAVIYEARPDAAAVLHIHHRPMWKSALASRDLPRSEASVPYGTPQMAEELRRLLRETSFAEDGVMAMAGHDEGLLAFGSSFAEAEGRLCRVARGFGQAV